AMEQFAEVIWPCTLLQASAIHLGAAMYPTRQPVIANPLANPLTVMVRSNIPGNDAMLTCSPVKLMCSYISSAITSRPGCFSTTSAISCSSFREKTDPVGLHGDE